MPRSKKSARTGKKKPTAPPIQTGWFTIRRILDERRVANTTEYLVDWDDDATTGASHTPTWVVSADVTALAKEEWKKSKASSTPIPLPATLGSSASQVDQSPRPANFRQIERTKSKTRARSCSTASSIDAGPATKRPRYSSSPSTDQVPSIVSGPSPSPAADVPEIEYFTNSNPPTEICIGIPKAPNFDTSEFFSVCRSQSASHPSQSLSELEEQDQRVALSSQISLRTVPDSQDYSGQSLSTASLHKATDHFVSSLVASDGVEIPDSLERDVIPDSLDRDRNHTITPSGTGDLQEYIPQSSIPAGLNASSVIPSHQEVTKEQSLPEVLGLDSNPGDSDQPHRLSQIAAKPSVGASSGEALVFLSQIEIHEPSLLLSSSPGREPSPPSPSQAAISTAPQVNHGISQDAQVVHNFLDTESEDVTDSNNTKIAEISGYPLQHDISMADNMHGNSGTQRSAVDELNELFTLHSRTYSQTRPEEVINQPINTDIEVSDLSETQNEVQQNSPPTTGALESSHWHPPTVEAVDDPDLSGTGIAFDTQPAANTQILVPIHTLQELPDTISPSDILETAGAVLNANTDPMLDSLGVTPAAIFGSSEEHFSAGQQPPGSPSSSTTSDEPALMQHVITLPFQANLRPQYDDTLLAHRKYITEFSKVFSNEEYVDPKPSLVAKIDDLFLALRNYCDYPQDLVGTTLEKLSPPEQAKYACDANPKFCFVFELLQGIETNIRVLIIAQSIELLQLLAHITTTLDIDCSARALGSLDNNSNDSACNVTLALPSEEIDIDEFEVVIGFDHSFSGSPVAKALSPEGQAVRPPMLLSLVTTHSIEHIDRHLPEELSPLERRNALLATIVNARKLTTDPDRGYPEPHEIASMFCDFLNGAVEGVLWDPIPVPEEVLDIYMSSQSQSQQPAVVEAEGNRKRKLDDYDEEEAKRARTIPKGSTTCKEEVPLPDDVRQLLDSASTASENLPGSGVSIQISLSVLQAIAEKMSELERRVALSETEAQYKAVIESLEARLKEYERTSGKTYEKYRAAVEERSNFEREKKEADAALQSAQEAAQKKSTKLQAKIEELEAAVSRLTSGGEGEGANPLATSEKLLQEARQTANRLEKRLQNATQDGEYAKNAYQEASSAATALQTENRELKGQNEKLRSRGSENVVRIHEMQHASMAKVYLKQVDELQTQKRERERELDRVREELRQARTRRETRQASVPRSPRMGLMSHSTGRPNPTSRGTSPTGTTEAGGAMIGAQPNGRWNHLRE
ncbi:hypothetical protein CCM_03754 [Cordyceps militaris CM01]|uniref:Chromo domain-containing protein n=1 Tax=Cordyceps militaris (strain CM01) TaxID=983644 RepID=G3JGG4_CORMM|nr:uncharacterized protein CCM_03754 [Cordyceps militaris CM01]EGX92381.1 hypothetical protein CCM_03754 [Cordyceps militaris CM01]